MNGSSPDQDTSKFPEHFMVQYRAQFHVHFPIPIFYTWKVSCQACVITIGHWYISYTYTLYREG